MDKRSLNRLDIIMGSLKSVEVSASFDSEFKNKLEAVRLEAAEMSVLEKAARIAAERLKDALVSRPRVTRFAGAMAAFAVFAFIFINIYFYILPAGPSVLSVNGIVLTRSTPDSAWQNIGSNYRLKVGDEIKVGDHGQLDFALKDKYSIRIKDGGVIKVARLTTRSGKSTAMFKVSSGRMFVDVEKGFSGSRFLVSTDGASVKALGTKFSVDVTDKNRPRTRVSVLEGKVEVRGDAGKSNVLVRSGQMTDVVRGENPMAPSRLDITEWRELEELYDMGGETQVVLILKNTPDRVAELLKPCPIYISAGEKARISKELESSVRLIKAAIESRDKSKHIGAIKNLEKIALANADKRYAVKLLSYIGAYYEYLGMHKDAIEVFNRIIKNYPESTFASLSQAAIAVIYDEKLKDANNRDKAYQAILKKYPDSLEAIWLENKLGIKKL